MLNKPAVKLSEMPSASNKNGVVATNVSVKAQARFSVAGRKKAPSANAR